MADHESFLRAILERPADATLRLVYADWLDERGDPRAEFIRLTSELELTNDMRDRAFELFLAHWQEWLRFPYWLWSVKMSETAVRKRLLVTWVNHPVSARGVQLLWRGGFPTCAVCPPTTWSHMGHQIVKHAPIANLEHMGWWTEKQIERALANARRCAFGLDFQVGDLPFQDAGFFT